MTDTQQDVATSARSNTGTDESQAAESAAARAWSIANPRRVRLP